MQFIYNYLLLEIIDGRRAAFFLLLLIWCFMLDLLVITIGTIECELRLLRVLFVFVCVDVRNEAI